MSRGSIPRTLRSRLRLRDIVRQALLGLTSRKLRTALTALGISIGIASLIAITEFDPQVEDRWELWIAAQRELGTGERRTAALLDVMER